MNNLLAFPAISHKTEHCSVNIDKDLGAARIGMHPAPRPCFTPQLLEESEQFLDGVTARIEHDREHDREQSIRYVVLASEIEEIFNLGGDLNRFIELIGARDREALMEYALACIRCTHRFSTSLDLPLTTIALVRGRAQGGGFEAALSANVLIAERGTQMGFPEVLFNLFPGMGAYSFLSRKIAPSLAERMILSGNLYPAEELYEMGIVDVLADAGEGEAALRAYIRDADQQREVHGMMQRVRDRVPFSELRDITELWVESALRLEEKNLRTMQRLVRAQDRRLGEGRRQAN